MVLSAESEPKRLAPMALWVVPVSDLGGVARHVLDVAGAGLPGWRLVVLCPEGPLAERLRTLGSAVIAAPFGPEVGFPASLATLRSNIRRLRPDIVHSHLAYADVTAAVAVTGLKTRLVTTEHGIAGDDTVYHGSAWKSRIKALLHHLRLLRADTVVAVSEATREAMLTKWRPKQPITVIRNGVEAFEIRRQVDALRADVESDREHESQLRVLSLSRLAPEKRLDVLLRAFVLVRESEPSARLTVAGTGPELEPLKELTAQLGLSSSVDFVGFVDPLRAMAGADVLVQLSVWENCSYTLLDAVSAGIGVVATPVGGNPEILGNACLVSANDASAVARKIVTQNKGSMQELRTPNGWPDLREMVDQISRIYLRDNEL